ncbi:peptidoglycan DD-metalloendopeptidase family protein [Ruminococcaceae bacterium OttesenSCG-928-A16]|nr:peptidoglycan DD-metalloendopeptidase family protein [Ruminococcaceae bacterium OttesenSCG-928-A16]
MTKKTARFTALLCALVLCLGAFSTPVLAETPAEKYKRLKQELAAIASQLEDTQSNKAAAQQRAKQLAAQKQLLEEAIAIKQQVIDETRGTLAAKEEEIVVKRQAIFDNDQLFQQRLIAIYKMNNSNLLSELLHVDSFSEALTVADSLQRISDNDTVLLQTMNAQREQLEAEQAEINAALNQLELDYQDLENDKDLLAQSISANDAAISKAQADEAAQKAAYNQTKEDTDAAYKAWQASVAAGNNASGNGSQKGDGSQYVGGKFVWPVPGHFTITCYFGAPDPSGRPHRGMDISGNGKSGAPIVAAGNGTVITAVNGHSSYGNYLVIDHGNGTKTLYAHCQSLAVGYGQQVATGQTIAYVGSTGYSTGPHLHFEVFDPTLTNPLPYLQG